MNRVGSGMLHLGFVPRSKAFTPYLLLWGSWSLMLIVWQAHDERAPLWDMAYHWTRAHVIHQALVDGGKGLLAPLQGYYPPLFSCALGLLEFLLPYPWPLIALHIAGVLIAAFCYYLIHRCGTHPEYGWLSFGFLLGTPLMVWFSHEAIIDVMLTLWVFFSFTLLLATHHFKHHSRSLGLGLAMGLGLLMKWTFAVFLFFPVAWTLLQALRLPAKAGSVPRIQRIGHAVAAGLLALLVSLPWYLWNLETLRDGVAQTLSDSVAEGDPQTIGWDWLSFYPRLLLSYGLQLPMLLVVVLGAGVALYRLLVRRLTMQTGNGYNDHADLLLVSCLGSFLAFQFFPNKDLRYLMPLLPWLSLLASRTLDLIPAWQRRKAAAAGSTLALMLAAIYFFAPSWIPASATLRQLDSTIYQERVLLPRTDEGWNEEMVPTHHIWGLWNTSYVGILGAPASRPGPSDLTHITRELDELISSGSPVVIGVIPDQPRLNVWSLLERATRQHKPWVFVRLLELPPANNITYVIGLYGNQGVSWSTQGNRAQLDWLSHSGEFKVARRWQDEKGEWMIWKRRAEK